MKFVVVGLMVHDFYKHTDGRGRIWHKQPESTDSSQLSLSTGLEVKEKIPAVWLAGWSWLHPFMTTLG